MRTTLTIDDSIERKLRRLAAQRGESYKDTVNAILREGLLAVESAPRAKVHRTQPRSLGMVSGIDYDKVGQLGDELDDVSAVLTGGRR